MLGLLLILALSGAAFTFWFLQKERDVTSIANDMFKRIDMGPMRLQAEAGTIAWRGLNESSTITLRNVTLSHGDVPIVKAPFAYASVNIVSLITGAPAVKDLEIHEIRAHIAFRDRHWMLLDAQEQPIQMTFGNGESEDILPELPFHELRLKNSQIALSWNHVPYRFDLRSARLDEESFDVEVSSSPYGQNTSFRVEGNDYRTSPVINAEFRGFNPGWLCHAVLNCYTYPQLDMPLDGTVHATLSDLESVQRLDFSVSGKTGQFRHEDYYPRPIHFTAAEITGSIDVENSGIALERFAFEMGETTASGSLKAQGDLESPHLQMQGQATNMPVEDLRYYWPQGLSPQSREWATTNVRDGVASQANVTIAIEPEDMQPEFFPDDILRAEVQVKDTTVEYLEGMPPAEHADGIIHFTGTTMRADVSTASLLSGGKVNAAKVHFPDLNAPGTPVEIDLDLQAPAEDVVTFLKQASFNPLPKLPITIANPKGEMQALISLAFDAFTGSDSDEVNWDAVQYAIDASLQNVSGITAMDAYTIANISGPLQLSNTSYHTDMKAQVAGAPTTFTYTQKDNAPEHYAITTTLPIAELSDLAPAIADYARGAVGIDASFARQGETISGFKAELDLTPAALSVADLGYVKPKNTAAKATITQQSATTYAMDYASQQDRVTGTLKGNPIEGDIQAVVIDRLQSGGNDIALEWQPLPQGDRIFVHGNKLNLTPILESEDEGDGSGLSDFPNVQLAIDVKEISGANELSLRNVKGNLDCQTGRCESAELLADQADGKLAIRIYQDQGRRFAMQAYPADYFFGWLNVTSRLRGGKLGIDGVYDDSQASSPLVGRIRLDDFTVKDAPILGRLLNLASITGLVETLSTSGISFEYFKSDLVFADDVADLKDLHAAGASIGILGKAQVNLKTDLVDIRGNLVPAYTINSLLSKVPLVGELLAGDEGAGIVGFDFRVHGDADDPDVTVNPLSGFTPGFTRKFFNLFSTPLDTEADNTEPAAATPEAVPPAQSN